MKQKVIFMGILMMLTHTASAQQMAGGSRLDTLQTHHLDEVVVAKRKRGTSSISGAVNGTLIHRDELFKAACCNLGESFVTNPSVDVTYSDATTGAKQIKLLGLSGTYVQMLTENIPNFRGASTPYALGYVPGPWMKGISVSKGASSVKNGYESITGQINVQYLPPEEEEGVTVNLFGSTQSRFEANVDGNLHLNKRLSAGLLAHYENSWSDHDGNCDGFMDQPKVRQWNLQNRWHYADSRYIFHGGMGALKEKRDGGQTSHHTASAQHPFAITQETDRYEAYMKHAFVIDPKHGTNIALMTSASLHKLDATYGHKFYNVDEKNLYAQLLFETNFTKEHNLSAGGSVNHDYFKEQLNTFASPTPSPMDLRSSETTWGMYAQYTYNLRERLVAMAGVRLDYSNVYGTFFTPRFHVKWQLTDEFSLRASAGKGYRSPHALAEYNYLLASGRELEVGQIRQERAWNYGLSAHWNVPIGKELLRLNAEYYYTHFTDQMVVDYDSNRYRILIDNLNGKSYSHTFQIDASYVPVKGMTTAVAWRFNDVRTTFGGELLRKPLQSKYKGLFTASYKTPLGLWQFDATLQLNGGGRMPKPYQLADGTMSWDETFGSFCQLSAQVTRWFRHFSIYIGGENLTAFKQKNPIIGASEPWGREFEPTLVWGPVHGAMAYVGMRINIGRM